MGDSEGDKSSKFNAGVALAQRLDTLQKTINSARYNLTMVNILTGTYNYEVMIQSVNSLLSEAWGKMNEKEQEEGLRIRDAVVNSTDNYPLIEMKKDKDGNVNPVENKANKARFLKAFDLYERKVKEYLEAHDLNAPNRDLEDDDEI